MAIFYDKLNRLATGYLSEDALALAGEMSDGKKVMLIIHNNDFWEYALIQWLMQYYRKSIVAAENPLEQTDLYVFGSIAEDIWNFCQKHGNPIEMAGFKSFYAELMTDIYWDTAKDIFRRYYGSAGLDGDEKMYVVNAILSYLSENCEVAADGEVLYDEERTLNAINPCFKRCVAK